MNSTKFNLILAITFVTKLVLAWKIPVFGDESYYWFWGQHLQLSYFDHPGMVGWMTWVGSLFQFLPNSLIVRWPFVFTSTLSLYFFVKILLINQTNNEKTNLWLIGFYLLNPLLGIGGILATPDVPLVFFWTLSHWIVLLILKNQRTIYYGYLGAALGLGLCSKYHIVLFPVSIFAGLIFTRRISEVNFKKLVLTFIVGLLFSMPVLIWNYQNNWSSFAFQLNHGFNGKTYTVMWTLTYLLGQIFLFNPLLLYSLITEIRKSFSKTVAATNWVFFLISSLRASVESNWPITSHVNGIAALADSKSRKFLKPALIYFMSVWIIFLIYIFSNDGQKKFQKIPNSLMAEKVWDQIHTYQPLYGPTYQMSSLLHLISDRQILKLNELSRFDFYDSGIFTKPTEKIFYALKYNTTDWPIWLHSAKKTPVKKISEFDLTLHRIDYE